MGIEMRLHLLSMPHLDSLLKMEISELISGMETHSLRNSRPQADERLHHAFDIDAEAEILDLCDKLELSGSVRDTIYANRAHDLLLKLVEWCSPGYWESWEGRCFIYLEVASGEEAADVDSMYLSDYWQSCVKGIRLQTETEYAEAVVQNWMERRKALGETLDEKKDPRILSTFEAHDRAARILHHAMMRTGLVHILGREHLSAADWGHGEFRIGALIESWD